MKEEEYLKQRVDSQLDWYSDKAKLNKQWYIRLEAVAILLSVSIPFVSNFMTTATPWVKHCVSFMGVAIAGISGFLALMKYRDNWVEYRTTAELLRHERYMFLTRTGAYAAANRFDIFVQTIENLLSKEVANWKNYQSIAPEVANPTMAQAEIEPKAIQPTSEELSTQVPTQEGSNFPEDPTSTEGA
ncbi:MAG: DUF4231 domain-containing protein [Bacteroidetes bacterium]|nr:DUF4231 domain-containing protein [Bacteroidota bacterium]